MQRGDDASCMRRRLLLLVAVTFAPGAAAERARTDPAARERELQAWWARQREKEEADRFWNGPRERRRNVTRDQIERWEYDRWRRRYSPYHPYW
jgi:hypothetical protein